MEFFDADPKTHEIAVYAGVSVLVLLLVVSLVICLCVCVRVRRKRRRRRTNVNKAETSYESVMDSTSKLQQMLNEDLIDISASWEDFGTAVGIEFDRIEKIRTEYTGKKDLTSHCFKRVINAWLRDGDVSKNKLVKALCHTNHGNLAKKVKDQEIEFNYQSLCTLLEEVHPDYSEFGIFLGVPNEAIKKFEVQRGNADLCLLEVISDWFEMEGRNAPSKEGLRKALEYVSRNNLAKDLEEKYKDLTFPGDEDLKEDHL